MVGVPKAPITRWELGRSELAMRVLATNIRPMSAPEAEPRMT